MWCIVSHNTDPYFNLAAEEYLLKHTAEEACMLWRSHPAVIVGKHQNTLSEINYRYSVEKNIQVARRLTGGGAVFHDLGNLNFSFIIKAAPGKQVDFQKHITPVIHFLRNKGIHAVPGPKNEILVDSLKISGNAEHIYKQRVLHHGTLLFDTDLTLLNQILSRNGGNYHDRAVQSNRGNVVNLKTYLPAGMTTDQFMHDLQRFLLDYFQGEDYSFSSSEENIIQELAESKYRTWKWTYGWSPDYEFRNNIDIGGFRMHIYFKTHKSVITDFIMESGNLTLHDCNRVGEAFIDVPHSYDAVRDVLKNLDFNGLIGKEYWNDFVFGFF